jgi:glycosyltransferase involved in cell wall biosynthesis
MTRREQGPRRTVLMMHDYPPLTGGGLALNVRELADLLAQKYDVIVLSARLQDHFADDRAGRQVEPGVGVTYGGVTPPSLVRAVSRASLLVTHWTFSFRWLSTLTIVLGPLLRKPTVCVIHTAPDHLTYNRLRHLPRWLQQGLLFVARCVMRRCVVVALGPSHAATLTVAGLPVSHVLPLMVSLAPVGGPLRTAVAPLPAVSTIGIVGELSMVKGSDGIPRLLRALTPDYAFRIAGSGPLAAWLARQVEQLSAHQRDSVTMTGHVDPHEMAEFYRTLDVLLVLSRSEAQPRAILEAMLSGVVVVASQRSGGFDLIVDGTTGVLVDLDDLSCVRRKITSLAEDTERSAALRRNAAELARTRLQQSRIAWPALVADLCRARASRGDGVLAIGIVERGKMGRNGAEYPHQGDAADTRASRHE